MICSVFWYLAGEWRELLLLLSFRKDCRLFFATFICTGSLKYCKADSFHAANVQVAIRFRREARVNLFHYAAGKVFIDDLGDKIAGLFHCVLSPPHKVPARRAGYKPEELVGKQVLFIANLAPRQFKNGLVSEGMILSAENFDGTLAVTSLLREVKPGSEVK